MGSKLVSDERGPKHILFVYTYTCIIVCQSDALYFLVNAACHNKFVTLGTTEGPPHGEVISDANVLAEEKSSPRSRKNRAPAPALGASKCRKRSKVNIGGRETYVQQTTTTTEGAEVEEAAATTIIAEKVGAADRPGSASFAPPPRIVYALQRLRPVTSVAENMGDLASSQKRANGSVDIDISSLSLQGTVRLKQMITTCSTPARLHSAHTT